MSALTFERRTLAKDTIERRTLAKDTLSAIWGFCTDKKFVGHDGREYVIAKRGE